MPTCDVHVELLKEEMPVMSFLFLNNYVLCFVMLIVNG